MVRYSRAVTSSSILAEATELRLLRQSAERWPGIASSARLQASASTSTAALFVLAVFFKMGAVSRGTYSLLLSQLSSVLCQHRR